MATQTIPQSTPGPFIPPALPAQASAGVGASAGMGSLPSASAGGNASAPNLSNPGQAGGLTGGPLPRQEMAAPANLATLPAPEETAAGQLQLTPPMARMPVDLQVMVPVREFRVRNLLTMAAGTVIESQWANGEDLPLSSGDVQLAWTEFEVVDNRLAVRVTRLA